MEKDKRESSQKHTDEIGEEVPKDSQVSIQKQLMTPLAEGSEGAKREGKGENTEIDKDLSPKKEEKKCEQVTEHRPPESKKEKFSEPIRRKGH